MAEDQPVVRVVRGAPTPAHLAALIAVLHRRSRPPAVVTESVSSDQSQWVWSSRPGAIAGGLPVRRGPHSWRRAALPH